MVPEMIKKQAYDNKVDIWSLGVILYEIMTGERPFQGDYNKKLKKSIINDEYKVLPIIFKDEIKELLSSMLNKNPKQRPIITDVLCHPLIEPYVAKIVDYGETICQQINLRLFIQKKLRSS